MNEVQTRIKAAEWYVDRGFRAGTAWGTLPDGTCRCPKGADCGQKPGKHPVSPHGFHDATNDQATINKLLSVASEPNLLVVPPPGCFGWDLDGNDAVRIRDLEGTLGPLPPTLGHQTPNGRHVVYRWPEGVQRPSKVLGVVTRWGGDNGEASGYLIGAGSRIGAKTYRVLRGQDGRPLEVADLAEAWVTAALAAATTKPAGGEFGPGYRLPERVESNSRYFAVRDYVASRWRPNVTEAELWLGVRDVLALQFVESKPESELREDFDRAMKNIDKPRDKWDPNTRSEPKTTINTEPVGPFPEPDDMGVLEPCPEGTDDYVDGIVRPGRIVLIAAEEGSGKTQSMWELSGRLALGRGSFAETWLISKPAKVLYLSQQHPDDDIEYLERVCAALEVNRSEFGGRIARLDIFTAANGAPILKSGEWCDWIARRCAENGYDVVVIDTGDDATEDMPFGRPVTEAFRALKGIIAKVPRLAIVLVVHLRKPGDGSLRRISDIRGEWGRRPDIVMLMQADGETRTRLSLLKRTTQKTIIATKRGGLLVDPVEPQPAGPKVSQEKFLAAVKAEPGLTPEELAARLGVTDRTIRRYAFSAGDAVRTVEVPLKGSTKRLQYFPIDTDNADNGGNEHVSASLSASDGGLRGQRTAPIYRGAVLSASPTDAVEGVAPADAGPIAEARRIFGNDLVEGKA